MRQIKVLLIVRDSNRGGKSVESIFSGLIPLLKKEVDISRYEYSDQKSVLYNYRKIMGSQADLFHITSDIYWLSLLLPSRKCILTIHDIGHYLGMSGVRRKIYKRLFILWPVKRAISITTVSHFTMRSLMSVLPQKLKKKIVVIPNPVPPGVQLSTIYKNAQLKIILQVGTSSHKNCETVIQAMQGLPYTLHILGPLSARQRDLIESTNIQLIHSQNATHDQVLDAYKQASAITFISSFEGFGMPVIEAQAIGRPVITSTKTSLPEIAGSGAHYVEDPKNIIEVREAIIKVMEDKSYQESLVKEGYLNVRRFDREDIAKKYTDLYKAVFVK